MSFTDTILIVDDSSFIVEGLVSILKKSYRTLAVYGGQQCLDTLKTELPSIIILDIMMEPMDGWETLARIKENPSTRHIPVLMFSAKKISSGEAEEHRISIDDFVSKPVTPKKLIESIEKVLARKRANDASIESWRSAGIAQDRIDEYISLITSQEVDMSLIQNMKVQHSLLREDDDKIRTDLEAVISAIEGRIQQGHILEEKFSRDMQESIAKDNYEKLLVVTSPVKVAEVIVPVRVGPETISLPDSADNYGIYEGQKNDSAKGALIPELKISREGTVADITTIPDVYLTENKQSETSVVPDITGSESLFEDIILIEEPEIMIAEKLPATRSTLDPVLSRHPIPPKIPEMHSISDTVSLQTSIGTPIKREEILSSEKGIPAANEKQSDGYESNPRITRTIDNKYSGSNKHISQHFGSGTDTSTRKSPVNVGKSFKDTGDANKVKSIPSKDAVPAPMSFISRIISTIIGLFKR